MNERERSSPNFVSSPVRSTVRSKLTRPQNRRRRFLSTSLSSRSFWLDERRRRDRATRSVRRKNDESIDSIGYRSAVTIGQLDGLSLRTSAVFQLIFQRRYARHTDRNESKKEIRRSIERIEERDNWLRYLEIFTLFRIEYLTAKKSSRFPFRTVLSYFNLLLAFVFLVFPPFSFGENDEQSK